MADNVTTQSSTLATPPTGTVIETLDTGSGHRQIVATGAGGSKAITTAAPSTSAGVVLAANNSRLSCLIQNVGSVTVYLGVSGVTTSGLRLLAGAELSDDSSRDAWYAITAAGTGALVIAEVA